jgi:hypothetical protein
MHHNVTCRDYSRMMANRNPTFRARCQSTSTTLVFLNLEIPFNSTLNVTLARYQVTRRQIS